MKLCSCVLSFALALLGSCGTNTPATTASEPTAAPASAQAASNPGEVCTIKVSDVTFTRSLNGAAKNTTLAEGRLILRSDAKRDYFSDPDGKLSNNTAPVLLTQVNNRQPFTLIAKVTPTFLETYDAGVLYLYVRDDWWQKFAFERDERARTRIVSVRTIGTSDDNNHDVVSRKQVYMKMSSDTKTIGFYYSPDRTTWELVRLYKNDYPATIWLGVSSQSPVGEGMSTQFEECSLTNTSIRDFRMGL